MTGLESKTEILADLWMNYRGDEEFSDFLEYNDLGLPLAYASLNKIVKLSPQGEAMIDETFSLLLTSLGLEDTDEGYQSLDDLLGFDFQ
jgi:hypothetical protein